MNPLFLLLPGIFCLLVGCVTPRNQRGAYAVASASGVVDALSVASREAGWAKASIQEAKEAAEKLRHPSQEKLPKLRGALSNAEKRLNHLSTALTQSTQRATLLEREVQGIARDLAVSEEKVSKAEEGQRLWRGRTWKASGVAGALVLWLFRRPLLAFIRGF